MKRDHASNLMRRRDFLKTTAALMAAAASNPIPFNGVASAAEKPASGKMIGIQVGAVSFFDEGVAPVLDIFQERGAVNTIFLTTFTYGRGLAGRQVPGQPFPDHGKQESDESFFHGGNYATPHPEYYANTILKETRAPDHGTADILQMVLPEAKKRWLDFQRAREGYTKLDEFVQSAVAGKRPSDGYFVEFWRLIVEYPEIIAWDRLFDAGKHQVLGEIYSTVKQIRPSLQVGFHI